MRIILTIDYSPWSRYSGGAQLSTHNIAVQMAQWGHEVHVINTKSPMERISVPGDLPYAHHWATLPARHSKQSNTFRFLSAWYVNKEIEKILGETSAKCTLIHANGEEGGLVHRLRGRHNFGFISTPRHPHYPALFYNYAFEKLPLHAKVRLWLRHSKFMMQAKAARNADMVCPPSRWSSHILKQAFDIPERKIHPVHNGVPDKFLHYSRREDAQNGPIVFFGRFSYTKGLDTLIEALGQMEIARLPDVYLIGRGPMEHKMRRRTRMLGLGNSVHFKAWMPHDQLAGELSRARMAVLPSREENFSLAVLGAMAVGVPVISTNVGGTPEIINHQENGLLVAPDNPVDLASSIGYLLDNEAHSKEMGVAAYRHIRKHFTWQRTAGKFEKLYERLCRS